MKTSKIFIPLFATVLLVLTGCGEKSSGPSGVAPVDYLDASAKAKVSTEKKVETIAINNAIQMFSSQEGRYPTDLKELVSKGYMRGLPNPPVGTKFEYDAATGEVKVVAK